MSVLGKRVLRREDMRMLTAGARYVADVDLGGVAQVAFVRSSVAHGRLVAVDADAARRAPGVLGVFTAADLDLDDLPANPHADQRMTRPVLAAQTVRYVGEPVAAVVADTAAAAADAAETVLTDVEALPAVTDLDEAATVQVLLHPHVGTNIAFDLPAAGRFAVEAQQAPPAATGAAAGGLSTLLDFSGCEAVAEAVMVNQRIAPVPLESRAAAAVWSDDADEARLTFYSSTQAPHRVRDALAEMLGLDADEVRVVTPDVGGGFGAKGVVSPEELVVAALSRAVGRPVMWVETRSENLVSWVHGRAQRQRFRVGGDRSGRITHYEVEMVQDAGAYPQVGAWMPASARKVFTGCYDIANAVSVGRSYVTNTAPVAAYRGAGRPEANFAVERAMEVFAASIGMDSAEVRRRNFVSPQQMPYENPAGSVYDSGDFEAALDRALDAVGYRELRADQAARRAAADPMLLGVGIASHVEHTSSGPSEFGEVELGDGGSLVVRSGATPFGQGHPTSWAMIASEVTGVPLERISVVAGDTYEVARGGLTAGSRSSQMAGSAIRAAALDLVDSAKEVAAGVLEAAEADITFDASSDAEGVFAVAGSPGVRLGWAEVAAAAAEQGDDALAASVDYCQDVNSFSFGCHVAVVEIDSATGRVELLRYVACDDSGILINPLIAEGQSHGGIAQGIAQALLEHVVYDCDGNPLTANLADYPAISAPDLPSLEVLMSQTPSPVNPLGVKGIGESGTVGACAATANAVCDAVSHLGVSHIDMPATPQRVWKALSQAS